jgi:hypothetical protein
MVSDTQSRDFFSTADKHKLGTRFLGFREIFGLSVRLYYSKLWMGFILPSVLGVPVSLMLILLSLVLVYKLETGSVDLLWDATLLLAMWVIGFVWLFIVSLQWAYLAGGMDWNNFSGTVKKLLSKTLSLINYYILWLALLVLVVSIVSISGILDFGSVGPVIVMVVLPSISFFLFLLVSYTHGYILSCPDNLTSNLIHSALDTSSLYSVNLFRGLKLIASIIVVAVLLRFVGVNYLSQFWYSSLDIAVTTAIATILTSVYFVSCQNVYLLSKNGRKSNPLKITTWQNNLVVAFGYGLIVIWFISQALI